jgi:hypothetical protein
LQTEPIAITVLLHVALSRHRRILLKFAAVIYSTPDLDDITTPSRVAQLASA